MAVVSASGIAGGERKASASSARLHWILTSVSGSAACAGSQLQGTLGHPTDLVSWLSHHPAPGDPRAPVPCCIPTSGHSPISPTSSSSTSMRVRETPAISSAVMKEPTKARAMWMPRLSAGTGGSVSKGGVAGRSPETEEPDPGNGAPSPPPCTHPGSAQPRRLRCSAPGRTTHPGCSPPAPQRLLQGRGQNETPACVVQGVRGGPGGAHQDSEAGGRRWRGPSCAPASFPLPHLLAAPGGTVGP